MMGAVGLALILPFIPGMFLLAVLLRDNPDTGLGERICMAFPLGMGLLTFLMFLLGLLRVPLTLTAILSSLLALTAALMIWAIRTGAPLRPRHIRRKPRHRSSPSAATEAFLSFWIIYKLATVFLEASLRPIYAWDSWANWSVGPKLFLHAKSLLLDAPGADFFGGGAIHRFLSYPLHNHLQQVWLGLWTGGFDEVLAKMSTPLYFTCSAGMLFYAATRETGNRIIGLVLVAFMVSSPLASYHAIEVYADLLLGVYFLFASVAVARAVEGQKRYWPLAGFTAACALFVKEEAIFFIGPLALSSLAAIFRTRGKEGPGRLRTALSFIAPFLLIVPWYVFKVSHKLGIGAASLEFAFHPANIITAVRQVLSLENFNVVFLFFPFLIVAAEKRSRTFLHVSLPLLSYLTFFLLLYTCTVYYDAFFRNGTVFFRNLLTMFPTVLFLAAFLIREIWNGRGEHTVSATR